MLNSGLLRFSVQSLDLCEATDELAIRYTGDQFDIGFNASYLLEILRHTPAEAAKLTLKTAKSAAILESGGWKNPVSFRSPTRTPHQTVSYEA